VGLALIGLLVVVNVCAAAGAEDTAATERVAVLDTYGQWRIHGTLAPPLLVSGETIQLKYAWLNYKTPEADADWMAPEFNDRVWTRGPLGYAPKTALGARVCLRGKFEVTEPASVQDLRLTVGYKGGLIVYFNGVEIHREHIERGAEIADGLAGEERLLEDLAIPTDRIVAGVNVLGLEIVRSTYPEVNVEDVYEPNACEIVHARLSAAATDGLVPNVVRPEGLQVWNADALAADIDIDFGDRTEPLGPVEILGTRNGLFSGKVVVGSTEPIRGLKTRPGRLIGSGGVIPASNVRIRYGIPWGGQAPNSKTRLTPFAPYPTYANRLGALADEPPAEVEVMTPGRRSGQYWKFQSYPGQPKPVNGAIVPVWIMVRVPADVGAGAYSGSVLLEVQGEEPVHVPVRLQVEDYTLPDTQDYRTWLDVIESPDTLALEYGVPLWSDQHFDLIARSFRRIGETGARTLYVPLIAHSNLGNEQSMVRWIETEGGCDYDFSVMERYLDVARENMGTPKLIVFVVWDHYMIPASDAGADEAAQPRWRQRQMAGYVQKEGGSLGQGPMVTRLDPETGATELLSLPPHSDAAASRPLWKRLFDGVRSRLAERGLEDTMMLGIMSDAWPTKEDLVFFNEVSRDAPWVIQSHEGYLRDGRPMYDVARLGYQDVVWPVHFSDDGCNRGDRDAGKLTSLCGWRRPDLVARFNRTNAFETWMEVGCRFAIERNITGDQRGQGRIGGDYWKVLRGKQGGRVSRVHERYPESNWRNLIIGASLLAPGPRGPVATSRMEALRDGMQQCEARIAIERGLYDDTLRAKLPPDLIDRCEKCLRARHMMMWLSGSNLQCYHEYPDASWRAKWPHGWGGGFTGHNWFLGSGYRERDGELFALAGEVTRVLE
jgi:hypothetical protein